MEKVTVAAGQRVAAGQQIGLAGAEGNTTGCHLHFEVHPEGGTIYQDDSDPSSWLAENLVQKPRTPPVPAVVRLREAHRLQQVASNQPVDATYGFSAAPGTRMRDAESSIITRRDVFDLVVTKTITSPNVPRGRASATRDRSPSTKVGNSVTIRNKRSSAVLSAGDALIALGLGLVLATAYNLWFSNLTAHHEQVKAANTLRQQWQQGVDPLAPTSHEASPRPKESPGDQASAIPLGTGIAMLYVPRLGQDFHYAIVEGSTVPDADQLSQGPAHYADTQSPGQVGNFAVAGHRAGHGQPFANIDRLRSGDALIVETMSWWYVYRVLGQPTGSSPDLVRQQVAHGRGWQSAHLAGSRDRRPEQRQRVAAGARSSRSHRHATADDVDDLSPDVQLVASDDRLLAARHEGSQRRPDDAGQRAVAVRRGLVLMRIDSGQDARR